MKRALIAVGHKILLASYSILKDKVNYKELGGSYLQERKKDKKITNLVKQLQDLGMIVAVSQN